MENKIILGDCFEELLRIESDSVDLILTDPPYIISRDSNFSKGSDNPKYNIISIDFGEWDKEPLDLNLLFQEYKRVLRNGGTLIIFYDIWKSSDIRSAADNCGLKQPRVCQWVKSNPVPVNSKINYLSNAVEFFFVFVKGGKPTFNSKYDRGIYNYPLCHGKERTEHPTQKPLELFKELILKHSNEGDTVLDTFGGSGTTLEACHLTGRKCIIMENNLEYYDIIKSRFNIYQSEIS